MKEDKDKTENKEDLLSIGTTISIGTFKNIIIIEKEENKTSVTLNTLYGKYNFAFNQ